MDSGEPYGKLCEMVPIPDHIRALMGPDHPNLWACALSETLELYPPMFNRGEIACGKMMEILVCPFLKLAKSINYIPTTVPRRRCSSSIMNRILFVQCATIMWFKCLAEALGSILPSNPSPDPRLGSTAEMLRPEKRAELIQAMLEAEIPQVR